MPTMKQPNHWKHPKSSPGGPFHPPEAFQWHATRLGRSACLNRFQYRHHLRIAHLMPRRMDDQKSGFPPMLAMSSWLIPWGETSTRLFSCLQQRMCAYKALNPSLLLQSVQCALPSLSRLPDYFVKGVTCASGDEGAEAGKKRSASFFCIALLPQLSSRCLVHQTTLYRCKWTAVKAKSSAIFPRNLP